MKTIRIISIALIIPVLIVGFMLYKSIQEPVQRQKRINRVENRIKAKLKMIEQFQIAYLNEYSEYASSGEDLKNFVKNDSIIITKKTEKIVGKSKVNPNVDSIEVRVDTIGRVAVRDTLWEGKYDKQFKMETLDVVPGSKKGKKFEFYADVIKKKGGVRIPVMEVKSTDPIDKSRLDKDHPRGPLKIGSRNEPITGGNWRSK